MIFRTMWKKIFILLLGIGFSSTLLAHKSSDMHVNDILEVFGFKDPEKRKTPRNKLVKEWAIEISKKNIDEHEEFGNHLKNIFPGLTYQQGDHRFLFHWAYNDEPWTNDLEQKAKDVFNQHMYHNYYVKKYGDYYTFRNEFKYELIVEQRKRNAAINKKTEETFGFAHGGIEARYANRFASMAYNMHLLGDYMSDNTVLYGLTNFNHLLDVICKDIKALGSLGNTDKDIDTAHKIINRIDLIKSDINDSNIQPKADETMLLLKQEFPSFLKNLSNGSIKQRCENRGFKFVSWTEKIPASISNLMQSFKEGA